MDEDLTLREHRQGDEIFQHDEGAWNATAIREGINAELDTFSSMDMPLDRTFIDYCKFSIGASVKRAGEFTLTPWDDPGIIILRERGDAYSALMIDGHHRAVRR
jgi:hypothetical protein